MTIRVRFEAFGLHAFNEVHHLPALPRLGEHVTTRDGDQFEVVKVTHLLGLPRGTEEVYVRLAEVEE